MKFLFCLLLLTLSGTLIQAQSLQVEDKESIKKFIGYIRNNRVDSIASEMDFPFGRQYPLPAIKDSADFIKRFSQIFDQYLIKTIIKSNLSEDWSHVGWRGLMLKSGDVWLDDDGRLMSVNYQSKYETELRQQIIKSEKATLHQSIREYSEPICILETDSFRIRIDKLENYIYRYTSWNKKAAINSKPDLILSDGEIEFDGSGGNHSYTFRSGEYKYKINIIVMGETDESPALLCVYRNNELISKQEANFIGD
jgi:hypothetical protein